MCRPIRQKGGEVSRTILLFCLILYVLPNLCFAAPAAISSVHWVADWSISSTNLKSVHSSCILYILKTFSRGWPTGNPVDSAYSTDADIDVEIRQKNGLRPVISIRMELGNQWVKQLLMHGVYRVVNSQFTSPSTRGVCTFHDPCLQPAPRFTKGCDINRSSMEKTNNLRLIASLCETGPLLQWLYTLRIWKAETCVDIVKPLYRIMILINFILFYFVKEFIL